MNKESFNILLNKFLSSSSSIEFSTDAQGIEYAACDLTLRYTQFEVVAST